MKANKLLEDMEMMLPSELSLPFFSAITDKVCLRKYKS